MKIVHIWDQASYVENLMKIQNIKNVEMERFPKLPDFGLAEKIVSNSFKSIPYLYSHALDSFIRRKAIQNTYFEFHSVTLLEKYPELIPRTVLHIHGSEVRRTNELGLSEDTTSEFTRFALANVPLVFYSTPELLEVLSKYSTRTQWVPHVTNLAANPHEKARKNSFKFDAVFPSSLEVWKGSDNVLKLIEECKNLKPSLKFSSLKLGKNMETAFELGVHLEGVKPRKRFQNFLRSADIALGQGFGIIASADIESIQLGLRHFPVGTNLYSLSAYEITPEMLPDFGELPLEFLSLVVSKEKRYSHFENRVQELHSANQILSLLGESYNYYLTN